MFDPLQSLHQMLTAAGMCWLRVTATGSLVEVNACCAAAYGINDTHVFVNAVNGGSIALPAALQARLQVLHTTDAMIVVSRLPYASPLAPDGARMVTAASDDGMFDVLVLPEHQPFAHADDNNAFLQQRQHGVCVTDGSQVLFANGAFATMLGYAPEGLISVPCTELVARDDLDLVRRVQAAVLDGERAVGEFQVRLRMKDNIGLREVSGQVCRIHHNNRMALLYTVEDITGRVRSEAALRGYARRVRLLTQQIIDVQENERRNLARELHDEIGQQLTIVRLSLEAVRDSRADEQPLEAALASVADLTRQVRELSLDLRPSMLDDLGLAAALRWYSSRAAQIAGIHHILDIDPAFPRLRTAIETLYFRVGQEAITNVMRHAGDCVLRISLHRETDAIRLQIADDGVGFDFRAAQDGVLRGHTGGLLGMRERAVLCGAELHIQSDPGHGTCLSLTLPVSCAGIR